MSAHPLRSPRRITVRLLARVLAGSIGVAIACRPPASGAGSATNHTQATPTPPRPAVIALAEGERRFLRGETPLLIKIDPVNTGSQRMVLGSSDLPAGDAIGMHRPLQEDEILLVLGGN